VLVPGTWKSLAKEAREDAAAAPALLVEFI
jgi:hypothetical protein